MKTGHPSFMMDRKTRNGKPYLIGYHSQEFREMQQPLTAPLKCISWNAWLGFGYYFWIELDFAHFWGKKSKTRTGFYDVYKAEIEEDVILDACFSEEGYFFFKSSIEKALALFKLNGWPVNITVIHRYLVDKFWSQNGVSGILYDDLPQTNSELQPFYYRKRIQVVVFDLANIANFDLIAECQPC